MPIFGWFIVYLQGDVLKIRTALIFQLLVRALILIHHICCFFQENGLGLKERMDVPNLKISDN